MGSHVFVDETKSGAFTLAAVRIDDHDVARLRRSLRGLLLPGQERIHLAKEQDRRRREILSELTRHRIRAIFVQSRHPDQIAARQECLQTLLAEFSRNDSVRIVVERDDSAERADTRTLSSTMNRLGLTRSMSFELMAPRHDPGLWAADAIA
jgi:vacuolar-type H+-ATPase subunit F/Vma7